MKFIDTFAGQNWLITPAALAVNEGKPPNVHGQKWLLILSGVALVNLKGRSESQWLHETLAITPAFRDSLKYAINQFGIPRPPGSEPGNYQVDFQLIQYAPFAAPSAMYNEGHSVNCGFAVDVWRPKPFRTGTNVLTNSPVNNLFTGIEVDVAVRDKDAWLYRVSYNITVLGFIVYTRVRIT